MREEVLCLFFVGGSFSNFVRGRPFNSWGGEGVGDFEKKFPASACWKKKIACSTNVIEKKFLPSCKKEKKSVAKLFHHSGGLCNTLLNFL